MEPLNGGLSVSACILVEVDWLNPHFPNAESTFNAHCCLKRALDLRFRRCGLEDGDEEVRGPRRKRIQSLSLIRHCKVKRVRP